MVVEGVTGQVIEPLVYGHSTGLSPFSVVVAAIFWSWLWGPIGLILSTPLTLCLVVMGRHVKRLEFLDVMLGDRPALTPVESFYQRILAGDADEAQDHAELLLEGTLAVDLLRRGGAQGPAAGRQRRRAGRARTTSSSTASSRPSRRWSTAWPAMTTATAAAEAGQRGGRAAGCGAGPCRPIPIPADVDRADSLPPIWRGPAAVLCIAGRGPLDEAASAMLAQLLGKHGLGSRLVGYGEVSREAIETLDVSGVAMACVSYLDISGSPSHLRYLMQRLRQRLPQGTRSWSGLWPSEDSTLSDKAVQRAIGADYFTSSLAEAVTDCVEAARNASALASVRIAG